MDVICFVCLVCQIQYAWNCLVLYSVFREVRGVFSTLAGRKRGAQEEQNKREKGTLTQAFQSSISKQEKETDLPVEKREVRGCIKLQDGWQRKSDTKEITSCQQSRGVLNM